MDAYKQGLPIPCYEFHLHNSAVKKCLMELFFKIYLLGARPAQMDIKVVTLSVGEHFSLIIPTFLTYSSIFNFYQIQ